MRFKIGSRNTCVSISSEIELDVALSASNFNVLFWQRTREDGVTSQLWKKLEETAAGARCSR
jgi:hypothetical protein